MVRFLKSNAFSMLILIRVAMMQHLLEDEDDSYLMYGAY